jgi:hypothetical protein
VRGALRRGILLPPQPRRRVRPVRRRRQRRHAVPAVRRARGRTRQTGDVPGRERVRARVRPRGPGVERRVLPAARVAVRAAALARDAAALAAALPAAAAWRAALAAAFAALVRARDDWVRLDAGRPRSELHERVRRRGQDLRRGRRRSRHTRLRWRHVCGGGL